MIKVAFSAGQEIDNEIKVKFDNFKYRFFDIIPIAIWAGQEAENDFGVNCNH